MGVYYNGVSSNTFLTVHGGGVFCKRVFITSFTVDIPFLMVITTILVIYNRLISREKDVLFKIN